VGVCGAHLRGGPVSRGAQATYVLHRRGGALLRVLPVRNGAGCPHDTGFDAAYGQGNVPATGGSWRSTGGRSGTRRMARRNVH